MRKNIRKFNIAVVGATGLIGSTFLRVLKEYNFPLNHLKLFASLKSKGKIIQYDGNSFVVSELTPSCFSGMDIVFFFAGSSVSKEWGEIAEKSGAIVIDNSSYFRNDINIPLIVPEINIIDFYNSSRKIIANPNCSTIQAVLPLFALNKEFGLERVNFATYQAVSGSGNKGIIDLFRTQNNFSPNFYPYNISKTCIPQIGEFLEDGYTEEEMKMVNETRKILHSPSLKISSTCVRVPVNNCHAVLVNVTLKNPFTISKVIKTLEQQDGVKVLYENNAYPVSMTASDKDYVYVGRIRKDLSDDNSLLFYTVADNTRKGASSNALQIAMELIRYNLIK